MKIKIPAKVDVSISVSINFEIEADSQEEARREIAKYVAYPFTLDSHQVEADFDASDAADAIGETIYYASKGTGGGLKNLRVDDEEASESIEEALRDQKKD